MCPIPELAEIAAIEQELNLVGGVSMLARNSHLRPVTAEELAPDVLRILQRVRELSSMRESIPLQ